MKRRIHVPDPPSTRSARSGQAWTLWLERHVKRLEATGHARKTIWTRGSLVGKFIAYAKQAGILGPEGLSAAIVRAYLVHRRNTPNARGRQDRPRSLNTHLLHVRRFLEFLAREGVVASSLPSAVEYVRQPETLPRDIPSDSEVRRLLEAVDTSTPTGFRDRAILELFYSTGMRRQELINLKLIDVDHAQGYVRIEQGKGGKDRVVPLGRHAADWIRRYLLVIRPELVRGRQDPPWLFVSKSGAKFDPASVRVLVMRAAKAAGIEKNITPHALRRACATEMIRRRANPFHVKELLGHEDLRTLDVYAKLTILDLKDAHRRFHPREQAEGTSG